MEKLGVIIYSLFMLGLCFTSSEGTAIQLVDGNIDDVLNNNDLVIVNFYADWCRFSQMLGPVFDEAAKAITEAYPETGKVAFGKVDCDKQTAIAQRFAISKYPTLKVFRAGQAAKKEYRGQRTPEAFKTFVDNELKEQITVHSNIDEMAELDTKKRNLLVYMESQESENYGVVKRVASKLRDDCDFHALFGDEAVSERTHGDSVLFRPPQTDNEDERYIGNLADYNSLEAWALAKCVPLVREITFENAEGLTEEGKPFLILFHHPDDAESPKLYSQQVQLQLMGDKDKMNFLTGDGLKFSHPLHHLGKTSNDLPVIAIDSFRHMYIFPHNVKDTLETPGLLKQFIDDLASGKLHREFHHGPDATTAAPPAIDDATGHLPKETDSEGNNIPPSSDPPESVFNKLKPSRQRYTVLRDEL